MAIEKLNHWTTLLANIGVIISLIIVSIEIRQNSRIMHSQTRDSMTSNLMNYLATAYDNDELMNELSERESFLVDGEVVEEQSIRYRLFLLAGFRLLENEWYQYQRGLFDEEEFLPRRVTWERNFSSPGYQAAWKMYRMEFSPEFRMQIDELILENRTIERVGAKENR